VPDFATNHKLRWRKFVRKTLLIYLIPNVTLNTVIPYFALSTQSSVHLFTGEQNLARFILPMSLLLPFLITVDVFKKIKALQHTEGLHFECNKILEGKMKMFKLAGLHSLYTILAILSALMFIHFSFPANFDFGIMTSALSAGMLAGFYSITFFYLSVKKIREVP
jgi:hypothetical protein